MLAVGLTGGIGSGKSTVAGLLAERGALLVDADAIVRELQAPGGAAYGAIVERFGSDVVALDGTVDRRALAAIVFGNPSARSDLERLIHPLVRRVVGERLLAQASCDGVVVVDVPLLAEAGKGAYPLDCVVVVDCPAEVAVRRLVEGRGLSEGDARARVAAQASREDRLAIADFVVDNSGTPAQLEAEVERAWEWITSRG